MGNSLFQVEHEKLVTYTWLPGLTPTFVLEPRFCWTGPMAIALWSSQCWSRPQRSVRQKHLAKTSKWSGALQRVLLQQHVQLHLHPAHRCRRNHFSDQVQHLERSHELRLSQGSQCQVQHWFIRRQERSLLCGEGQHVGEGQQVGACNSRQCDTKCQFKQDRRKGQKFCQHSGKDYDLDNTSRQR